MRARASFAVSQRVAGRGALFPAAKVNLGERNVPSQRPLTSRADIEQRFAPILRLLGYWGPESTRAKTAQKLFKSCAVQAGSPVWSKQAKVPVTAFRPNHALLLTHVWMLHRRLHDFPNDRLVEAKLVQEVLFDELWDDTIKRVRQIGIPEISVDRSLADVQKYSFAAAVEYDQALAQADNEVRLDQLAAAVWRHVFLASDDPTITVDHCLDIAQHFLAQLDMLATLSPDDLLQANFKWIPAPRFGISSTKPHVDVPAAT